jgi:hypothetical protein
MELLKRYGYNANEYQVFVFKCPGTLPFSFASHPWFIINKKGQLARWELLFRKVKDENRWGHLYRDFYKPDQGIEIIPFYRKYFWKAKLVEVINGGDAKKVIKLIESSPKTYPQINTYRLYRSNSNVYAQWILKHYPDIKIELPKNAVGKRYAKKKFKSGIK